MKSKTEVTHTPTPWRLQTNGGIADILEGDKWVAGGVEINRAARIVRAVNSHETLLSALKDLLHQIETNGEREIFVVGQAIHAIAKAEGK